MVTITNGGARGRMSIFRQGYDTEHAEEIAMGLRLAQACILVHGEAQCRRVLAKAPASLFRSMHYGRRLLPGLSQRPGVQHTLGLTPDGSRFTGRLKAADADIMRPGAQEWLAFLDTLRRLTLAPRWADGWTATAEALDAMGYAIAETIAVLMLLDFDGDEDLVLRCHPELQR